MHISILIEFFKINRCISANVSRDPCTGIREWINIMCSQLGFKSYICYCD